MATFPIRDYTSRDYDSLVESLLDVAAIKLPEWTDRSENDLGRLLLELFAYVGDVLLYYQDRIANEAFLATAVERRSVIDLLGLIGYSLDTPAPAAVTLHVTPKSPTDPVHIDIGALFTTKAGAGTPAVEFRFLPPSGAPIDQLPVVDAAGVIQPIVITAVNATPVSSPLGQSNGFENQGFRVPQRPVLLSRDPSVGDGFVVEVQSGGVWEQWERRTTLFYSLSDDRHYVVRVDADDTAEVVFGDGTYGRIPPAGAPVRARYRIGGGSQGNVAPGTVTVISSGVTVDATVTNPAGASGGADRETIEHARRNAPGVYRSQQRAVTADDFTRLAESFPGVARAIAVAPTWGRTIPPSPGLVSWNYVDLIVVARGGLNLTDQLRASLLRYFERRRMVTTIVNVREPVFVRVDVTATVGVEPTFYASDVRQRVVESIEQLFHVDEVDFGQPIHISKVFEAAERIDGVAFVELPVFRGRRSFPLDEPVDPAAAALGRIPLRPREFPRLGTLVVNISGGLG